jgi:electron transfer flavoprotein beta subunit
MNIIVCVRQVCDPEISSNMFKIDPLAKRAIPPADKPMVVNPYDANALEAAVRLKETHGGGKVTVLSLGSEGATQVIRSCLATGADEGVLLQDKTYDDSDSFVTASLLAEAIRKIGTYDIIFCGREDADWDAAQVGSGVAELLGIPSVGPIKGIQVKDRTAMVERLLPDGYQVLEVTLPLLVAVSSEIGEPRAATAKNIMAAYKKPVVLWGSADILPVPAKNKMLKLALPVHEGTCEFIEGETIEEAAAGLAVKLKETGLF